MNDINLQTSPLTPYISAFRQMLKSQNAPEYVTKDFESFVASMDKWRKEGTGADARSAQS